MEYSINIYYNIFLNIYCEFGVRSNILNNPTRLVSSQQPYFNLIWQRETRGAERLTTLLYITQLINWAGISAQVVWLWCLQPSQLRKLPVLFIMMYPVPSWVPHIESGLIIDVLNYKSKTAEVSMTYWCYDGPTREDWYLTREKVLGKKKKPRRATRGLNE